MGVLHVKAAENLKVPKEGQPRSYIEGSTPVEMADSHYYRKAVNDGDLTEVPDDEWAAYQAKLKADQEKAEADAAKAAKAAAKTTNA